MFFENLNFSLKKIFQKIASNKYLLRVIKKLTSVLIAGFKKFNKNYPNEPTL